MAGFHVRTTSGGDENNPSAAGYLEFGTDKHTVRPVRLNSDGTISLGDGTVVPDLILGRGAGGTFLVNGSPNGPDGSGNRTFAGNLTVAGNITITDGTGGYIGRGKPRRVVLTDAATITPNADTTDLAEVTLAGSRTMAPPTNTVTAVDGQELVFKINQDGTGSRTLTWSSAAGGYQFPAGTAPTLTTTAGRTDYLQFLYHAAGDKWRMVGSALNFV